MLVCAYVRQSHMHKRKSVYVVLLSLYIEIILYHKFTSMQRIQASITS